MADDGCGEDTRQSVRVLEVWECNLEAVSLFQLCPVVGIGHMGGVQWTGIAPEAIHAACLLLQLPPPRWRQLAEDVIFMGQCVAAERNRQGRNGTGWGAWVKGLREGWEQRPSQGRPPAA